jgi:hypothetical protein
LQRVDVAASIALGAALAFAVPAVALELTLLPAWEGNYRPGAATEVLVRVVSPTSGELTLRAVDEATTFIVRRRVEPNTAVEVAFAILPTANALTVHARLGVGEPVERSLQLVPLDRPLVPVVADGRDDLAAWLSPGARYIPQPVAAMSLPRTAAGYGPAAAIVLASDTLERLDPEQREALRAHVAGCGRVLLPPDATEAAAALAATSACGERFVSRAEGTAAIAAALGVRATTLPGYEQILPLGAEPPRLFRVVVWFFVGYIVLLAACALPRAVGARATAALLALPVLASLLMAATWSENAPERRVLVWAEQQSGMSAARYRLVYDVHSRGTTALAIEAPAALGLPVTLFEQHAEFGIESDATRIEIEPRLLSRVSVGFGGTVAHAPSLVLERDAQGLLVANRGAAATQRATLVQAGRYYAVPALAAGATWRRAADAPTLPRPELPPTFPPRDADVLLLSPPLASLFADAPPHDSAQVWLALHLPTSGTSP